MQPLPVLETFFSEGQPGICGLCDTFTHAVNVIIVQLLFFYSLPYKTHASYCQMTHTHVLLFFAEKVVSQKANNSNQRILFTCRQKECCSCVARNTRVGYWS